MSEEDSSQFGSNSSAMATDEIISPWNPESPPTQPFDAGDGSSAGSPRAPWACLVNKTPHFITVSIASQVYSCGRRNCDYILSEPQIPSDCIEQYSRKHFVLERIPSFNPGQGDQNEDQNDFDVYLTDHSTNGTYVNGELVGKGNVSNENLPRVNICRVCDFLTLR